MSEKVKKNGRRQGAGGTVATKMIADADVVQGLHGTCISLLQVQFVLLSSSEDLSSERAQLES